MKKVDSRQHTFWLGYSDLMTSLFFISLVLFVIFYLASQKKQTELEKQKARAQDTARILKKLIEVENNIQKFEKDPDFEYNLKYKRFELKRQIKFRELSARIDDDDDRTYLLRVGAKLLDTIQKLNQENKNIQYMLIIEGMASADNYAKNDELSFERALAVYNLWRDDPLLLKKIHSYNQKNICKFQIVGSGTDDRGWGRKSTYDRYPEDQKIVIYIIPYVSYNELLEKGSKTD
ncbi:MAG: hypothetical protein RML38_01740 [Bacteroidia bacterium]|nr:hypothetical protein [Bacteroidia bacterium]